MDRRAYLKTVGAAGAAVGLAGCTDDGDTETIVPGTASGFAPFEYIEEETNELVGFDVDLAVDAIERAGYEAGDWVDIEFDSLIPSLTEGDIDLIAAAMTITDDRDEQIDFTDPYYEADQAVLVREDDIDPAEFADLEGRPVGAQSGTTGEVTVEEELVSPGLIDGDAARSYGNYVFAISRAATSTPSSSTPPSPRRSPETGRSGWRSCSRPASGTGWASEKVTTGSATSTMR